MFKPIAEPQVVIERRVLNLQAWHTEVAALTGQQKEVRIALGRKFREIFTALPRAEALKEVERHGHDAFIAARLVRLANEADGIAPPPAQQRKERTFTKTDLKTMLKQLKAGEVDAVIAALEEVV